MVGASPPVAPPLRIHLAGGFAVFVASSPTPAPLPAGRAAMLLALLLVRRGRPVGMDTIVEALWGGAPPAKAERNVASLVSPASSGRRRRPHRIQPERVLLVR
jgi:DNA-binding SARP family transcriptional activator